MKDVFRSGDSSKKFKIAEGQWYRYAPSYVSPAYHLLEGFPFIQEPPSGDLQERVLIRHHDYVFFQEEDGIRDLTVTGVQTCALPISPGGGVVVERACRRSRRHARHMKKAPRAVVRSCRTCKPARSAHVRRVAGENTNRWRGGSQPRQSARNSRWAKLWAFGVTTTTWPPGRNSCLACASVATGSGTCSRTWNNVIASQAGRARRAVSSVPWVTGNPKRSTATRTALGSGSTPMTSQPRSRMCAKKCPSPAPTSRSRPRRAPSSQRTLPPTISRSGPIQDNRRPTVRS